MGRSHAKNNTTQSTLTHYERGLLKREAAAQRIGSGSFKPLDSCYLCLSKVTDPCACPKGHIYCRECILSNLITQKAGIESQRREMERWEESERREREEARRAARERAVMDFEKGMGLAGSSGRSSASIRFTESRAGAGSGSDGVGKGDKESRFTFDGVDAVEKSAREAEEKAMRRIEGEQLEARKTKLAAFWLPSLAPEGKLLPVGEVKLQTLCHMGDFPHPVSRKTILPVILTYPTPTSNPVCPSCSKEISNSTSAFLLSSRHPIAAENGTGDAEPGPKKKKAKKDEPYVCGHVVCKTCTDTMVRPSKRCCVCDAMVEERDMIPLGKEGTGYAANGGVEVKRDVVSFRV